MAENTLLDQAHAAMEGSPDTDSARLRFFEQLAGSELYMMLTQEAEGEDISPEVFEVEGQSFVLVFDREARLAEFSGQEVPYVALSGRAVASMLAPAGLGIGLNLEVAPSSMLLPPDAVAWLAEMLQQAPDQVEAHAQEFHPPTGLPEVLLPVLDTRLASAGALADLAYLVGVTYEHGGKGHFLAFVDAVPGSERALAQMVSDVLRFSELEAAVLDVGFFRASDPVSARLARVGLRFDLPKPDTNVDVPGAAPGMDPARPPKLV